MTETPSWTYLDQLKNIVYARDDMMQILCQLFQIAPDAYIAAGLIRNLVWSQLHGQPYVLAQTEADVIYFDAKDDGIRQREIQSQLQQLFPEMTWDVVNQAYVHQWYRTDTGQMIEPLCSVEHALSLWPETATAVALRLNAQNSLECIAPFGLQDLFELKLRWNASLVSHAVFAQRIQSKCFRAKWPKLQLIDA